MFIYFTKSMAKQHRTDMKLLIDYAYIIFGDMKIHDIALIFQ